VKKHRREDDSRNEDRAENNDENQGIGHSSPREIFATTRRVTLSAAARLRQRDYELSF
jgi:hypothetical protein